MIYSQQPDFSDIYDIWESDITFFDTYWYILAGVSLAVIASLVFLYNARRGKQLTEIELIKKRYSGLSQQSVPKYLDEMAFFVRFVLGKMHGIDTVYMTDQELILLVDQSQLSNEERTELHKLFLQFQEMKFARRSDDKKNDYVALRGMIERWLNEQSS